MPAPEVRSSSESYTTLISERRDCIAREGGIGCHTGRNQLTGSHKGVKLAQVQAIAKGILNLTG